LEGVVLLAAFIKCDRCGEGKVEGLILPIEYLQGSFGSCPFPGGGIVRMLYYGIEKISIILVGLA
jgi:hypothetical protein